MNKKMQVIVRAIFLFIFIAAQTPALTASASPADEALNAAISANAGMSEKQALSNPGPIPAAGGSTIASASDFASKQPARANPYKGLFGLKFAAPLPASSFSGGLEIEPITAYNLIVDSNVLAPSSYGPNAASFGARYCNRSGGTLSNVWAYIGDYDAVAANRTPGVYPIITPATAAANTTNAALSAALYTDYGGTVFSLKHESGTTTVANDASRYIGTLANNQCVTQYWLVSYPRKAWNGSSWIDVTGDVKPEDDLWLQYDFWATSGATSSNVSYYNRYVTMRNEISAMANKIWPNGDNKVPQDYIDAIQQVLGWSTWIPGSTSNTVAWPGDTVTSQGIWYDMGVVGAGFDNNYDLIPDRNAWLQPIGDASSYDPGCFRLVRSYGLVIVKLNDGSEMLIPFVDQLYFENVPGNNTGAVGLVFYEYSALDGACTAGLTPYQEVASGFDNEKFNADFGVGVPPLVSRNSNILLDKTTNPVLTNVAPGGTINYTMTFTLPDIDNTGGNTQTVTVGNPSTSTPLTYYDIVPIGVTYTACSAYYDVTLTPDYPATCPAGTLAYVDMTNYGTDPVPATVMFSTDGGTTWTSTDPGAYTSSSSANQLHIKWLLSQGITSPASGAAVTGTVGFTATVPGGYTGSNLIENHVCMKIGDSGPPAEGVVCDDFDIPLTGTAAIQGTVWADAGAGGGTSGDGVINGTEPGIFDGGDVDTTGVTVYLYWDNNADGDYADATDFLYATTTTESTATGFNYCFDGTPGNGTCTTGAAGLPETSDSGDDITNFIVTTYDIVNGLIDVNSDGVINTADDATDISGVIDVIDGWLDMNSDGFITSVDDGTITGTSTRNVYNGYIDADNDGNIGARFIIVVDTLDADIPTGYGPTTTTVHTGVATVANTLYGDATLPSEPSDFGFAPALSVQKRRDTPSPVSVGGLVQFTLTVRNTLPGNGTNSNACVYYVYAGLVYQNDNGGVIPPGGGAANAQFQDTTYATGAPDERFTYSTMEDNTDLLGLSGFNIGDMGGNITKVEALMNVHERTNLKSTDNIYLRTYYNNSVLRTDGFNGGTYFTGGTGTEYIATADITSSRTWAWSDFASNRTELQIEANKGGGAGTSGDIDLDAAGFRITTDGTCGGADKTLSLVPLVDEYNHNYLQFVSASVPITSGPTGIDSDSTEIYWANVGPLYPGQVKYITVTFMALATVASTTNYDESTGAYFASGRPANSDLRSETDNQATVGIVAATNRDLTGRVFDDNNTNGWSTAAWTEPNGTTGYDGGDVGIPGIPVDLYVCVSTVTSAILTNVGANDSCAQANGKWVFYVSDVTDSNGDYAFTDLPVGFYYVDVHQEYISGSQTADVNETGTCATCDSLSYEIVNGDLEANPNPGDLGTDGGNTSGTTNVNFGYNVAGGSYNIGDTIYYDWDGDGVQDSFDEGISGVTVQLLGADGVTVVASTTTNSSGNYLFSGYAPGFYTVNVVTSSLPSGVVQTGDPDGVVMDNKSTFNLTATDLTRDFGYKPSGSGTIGDTVFRDMNGDGIQGGGESGISGITVQLQVDLDSNGTWVTIDTEVTTSIGYYLFTGLPAGTFRVVIDRTANASAIPNDGFGNEYTPSNGTLLGSTVYMTKTLATSTSSDLTADFGFAPPASIGDMVYLDLDSDGTQDYSEPGIPGVTVTLKYFTDLGDGDNVYDSGEPFFDLNTNTTRESNEPFYDKDGKYQPGDTVGATVTTTKTAYGVIDGRMDVNSDGVINTSDDGTIEGCTVTDGVLSVCSTYLNWSVVGGYIDADRDGVGAGDTGDDITRGYYVFTNLAPGYYLVEVTPPGTLTGDPSTDGVSCLSLTLTTDPPSTVCDNRDGLRLYNGTNYVGADFGYQLPGNFGDTVWIDADNDGIYDVGETGIPEITVTATTTPPNGAVVNGVTYNGVTVLTLTDETDANGQYSFTGITTTATLTWTVTVSDSQINAPTDPQWPDAGTALVNSYDPDGVNDGSTTVVMDNTGAVTNVGGCSTTPNGCDGESDALKLDADFGYRFSGTTSISGTICLETTVDGVCGTSNTDSSGVGSGETAFQNRTVHLYKLNDTNANGLLDPGETTILIATTLTDVNGDYSFTGLADGAGTYYVIGIAAPISDGLNMTSTTASVNGGGDGSQTTETEETTAPDGDTVSALQVINATATGATIVDRDFVFNLNGTYDFGDDPETYSVNLSNTPDGPRHLQSSNTLYFGTAPDTEANGQPSVDATGDGSDEDGVIMPLIALENTDENGGAPGHGWEDGEGVLQFDIVGSGWLVGWIDWNNDGYFDDAGEMVINRAVSNGANQDFAITTPNGVGTVPDGYYYSRFRLFTTQPGLPQFAYSGVVTNGEVEDYRIPVVSGPQPATLTYFKASGSGTITFEWTTANETGNLGFNLYDGQMNRINSQLVASSVLDSNERQDYTFRAASGSTTFYIEDVAIGGETRLHGPFTLGESYGDPTSSTEIDWLGVRSESNRAARANEPTIVVNASSAGVNLKVNQTGLYRVTYEALRNAGFDLANTLKSEIKLTNRGTVVPIFVYTRGTRFGAGSYIEFHATALDTLYTDTNVYVLQVGKGGKSVPAATTAANRAIAPLASFTDTVLVNNQNVYAEYAFGNDPWYDTYMYATNGNSSNYDFGFTVTNLAAPTAPATLKLTLWGLTQWPETNDHHVIVSINGVTVGDVSSDGFTDSTFELNIPAGALQEGANTLSLSLPGDRGVAYDVIALDKFSVSYQRNFAAINGRLAFTAAGRTLKVTNLPNKNVVVYRVDAKGLTRITNLYFQGSSANYSATFVGSTASAQYFVSTVDALLTPAFEAARQPSGLNNPAQYLIISHPNFISGLQPLIQARQAQGFTVNVVDVNDIYAQYSGGIFDPQALKDYVAYAERNLGTQYVLLVGGDSRDYRNYVGTSVSFIPSLYVKTGTYDTFVPSDSLVADVDNDKAPDVAIGRFPVRTTGELATLIQKTLAYASKDYGKTAVFVADKFDGVTSFKTNVIAMKASLPADWTSQTIFLDDVSLSTANLQMVGSMNSGKALVVFSGHSGPGQWGFPTLFNTAQAMNLTNAGRPFVALQWGCWDNYYADDRYNQLAQGLLLFGDRGAAATLGAVTRADSLHEEALSQLLTPRIVQPGMTIGQALQLSKAQLAAVNPDLVDVLYGFTILGDPALVIQP